jgi:S1-C subfamily serine protease
LILITGADGKPAAQRGPFVPIASGFLYGQFRDKVSDTQSTYGVYLVTNHHVWADIERIEKQQIEQVSKTVAVRETPTMFLRFNPKVTGPAQHFSLPIHNPDAKMEWVQDETADLAITPIVPNVLDKAGIQYSFFCSDLNIADKAKATEIGLTEGDGVYVLGFPMGLVGGERNFVIARQGVLARIRDYLAGTTVGFLIDALIFPGNSGGPVVTRPDQTYIVGTKKQDSAYVVGVVKAYIPYQDVGISQQTGRPRITFEENSGLAEVIPMDAVRKLIEAKEKVVLAK